MRSTRSLLSFAAAAGLAISAVPATPQAVVAQADGLTILVAPVAVSEPVDRRFGERIGDEVREALEIFAAYNALDRGDVRDLIKQYDLDERAMSAIEWRQLAMQMNASLVMVGTAQQSGGGIEVDITFMEPNTADELPMAVFTVADDRSHEEAAQQIMTQLETAVEYAQSLAFCADYLASEQPTDALRTCNRALELNPESYRALYLRGRAYMGMESWGSAVEDLDRVVANDPSDTEALNSLAFTHTQLGNTAESLQYYQQYLDFQPGNVPVRLRIAYELSNAGGAAQAVAVLQDGVTLAPEDPQLLEYLVGASLQAGQSGGEVTDAEMIRTAVNASDQLVAVQGDAVSPTTLSNATSAYMLIEEYDDALAFSDRALQAIQSSDGSNGNGGDTPSATKDELLAQVHASRAQIQDKLENPAAAVSEQEQALQYNPELSGGRLALARFKLKAGDAESAIADFRVAVQEGGDSDQIANALFSQGFADHFEVQQQRMGNAASVNVGEVASALDLWNVASEFAVAPDTQQQIHFFIGFAHYLTGSAHDARNEADEACGPARSALNAFGQVNTHMAGAGAYQAQSQQQIRDAVDVQLYRQQQIIESACQR